MSTYTLKSIARRGSMLGVAVAVLAAVVVPAASVFADALNPLTERSLLLSSSAPGYQDTDGSGNSFAVPTPDGGHYAPAGSGPNGKKTGEVFTFKVSTDSALDNRPIKAFTLQYCTEAAGKCQAPGNNTGDARALQPEDGADFDDPDYADTSAWEVRTPNRGADSASAQQSDLNVNFPSATRTTNFDVLVAGVPSTEVWTVDTSNVEDLTHSEALSGKDNFITLSSATGISPASGTEIQLVFKADETNYITNPGDDAFFVKINTYDSDDADDHIPATPTLTNTHIIDGGVTVANVMTDSIHITTKVLETMSFSVGTQNRDTVVVDDGNPATTADNGEVHGTCDPILQPDDNRLQLGNRNAEYSLETDTAYDVFSYWRLSSNSSGGATVYYSGNTLANTVGDEIAEIGPTAAVSTPGTEQFGLAFVNAGTDTFDPAFNALVSGQPNRFKNPTLENLGYIDVDEDGTVNVGDTDGRSTNYRNGIGRINTGDPEANAASFAFEKESNTIPKLIASNNTSVISCATAKMRYVANIGADTPAGVYTTKINYLAAPQY